MSYISYYNVKIIVYNYKKMSSLVVSSNRRF
jgi:hypothetical protein